MWNKFFWNNDIYRSSTGLEWVILWMAAILSAISIYYTHTVVNQIKKRETDHIHLYAKALEYVLNSENNDVPFATEEIIYKDNSIPTILIDEHDELIFFQNLDIDSLLSPETRKTILQEELASMQKVYPPIPIILKDPNTGEVFGKQFIYYKNSRLLTQLAIYPYVHFFILAVFGVIAYLAFNYSKIAEQNRIWTGLAKETAHQLGTPLSSLMAWVEILREKPHMSQEDVLSELDKDVKKFFIITERFSNIGSTPSLKTQDVCRVVRNAISYLEVRISSEVHIAVQAPSTPVLAKINAPLLEWVVEVLCKNAVDAMEGTGKVDITISLGATRKIFIDVTDQGKGLSKTIITRVFRPGFTTKKHGWGLGLSLAKRIIKQYHRGKIYIKSFGLGLGTTFRIELQGK